MIAINNLTFEIGARALYDEANWHIKPGEKIGLIGANGTGKTTLLKIIVGDYKPTSGTISMAKDLTMGYLNQDLLSYSSDKNILHVAMEAFERQNQLHDEIEVLLQKLETDYTEDLLHKLSDKQHEFEVLDGYNIEYKAHEILAGLGFSEADTHRKLSEFSGGWRMRVMLAKILLQAPDILLLDEPTNNLDVETISWLENFLADYENIVLVVSHDRHFLDAVCTHVADVDKMKIKIYTGNYSFWYESSQLAARQASDKNKKQEEKKKDLLEFIARFSANASKSKQATSRKKALDKLVFEDITASNRKYPGIIFKPEREVGNQILNIEKLSKSIDGKVLFSNLNFDIVKGQKIAFLSRDHVALTNFFEIINGKVKADHGKYEWGTTITSAYLPNDNTEFFTGSLNLMDWLRQFVPPNTKDVDEDFIRGFLGKMLFSGDEILKKTNVLSGGEKVRCMVSKMMLQNPNLVMLDEPTNHLDLESITAFNDGMLTFPGIVLFTTHDHQFMQTVANRIIEITPKGMIDRLMTYDEYLADDRVKALKEEMYS
ncbi:MAG TPA: ABC-F family ATP-binding cassette domain-containing protein [Ferruginibacter sp.]|nr:ABC-F family ATP-binding cassette domain-containing protein [Ferruginibacter sp.]